MGTVYLLHFAQPISPHSPAQHYLGYADDVAARIALHQQGKAGVRFTEVAFERGIPFVLARTWRGSRGFERSLKNKKCANRLCPVCNPRALNRAMAKEL